MKALILDGMLAGDASSAPAHAALVDSLAARGWRVESLPLRDIAIPNCLGCFNCWIRTPGVCIQDSGGRDVARDVILSDMVVFFTPVAFGGYSSELKKAVDQLIPNISPFFTRLDGETHHRRRYERYPRFAALGVLARPDAESERLFARLAERNAINLHAPARASAVVCAGQPADQLRQRIDALVARMGNAQPEARR